MNPKASASTTPIRITRSGSVLPGLLGPRHVGQEQKRSERGDCGKDALYSHSLLLSERSYAGRRWRVPVPRLRPDDFRRHDPQSPFLRLRRVIPVLPRLLELLHARQQLALRFPAGVRPRGRAYADWRASISTSRSSASLNAR